MSLLYIIYTVSICKTEVKHFIIIRDITLCRLLSKLELSYRTHFLYCPAQLSWLDCTALFRPLYRIPLSLPGLYETKWRHFLNIVVDLLRYDFYIFTYNQNIQFPYLYTKHRQPQRNLNAKCKMKLIQGDGNYFK